MSTSRMLDFEHVPGKHCASSALADLMRFWKIPLSEAMCFGLGSGLNFAYVFNVEFTPTRMFHGRGPFLERDFFVNTGLPLRYNRQPDPEKAWLEVKAEVDAGRPVLLRNDLYYLDYYEARNHFGGHIVAFVGYDLDKGIAYLTDTERPGMQTTSLESLAKARASITPPFDIDNEYFAATIDPGVLPIALVTALRRAISKNCGYMLRPELDFFGIPGMRLLADQLPSWSAAADWSWCAKYAYQMIQVRGTGGANFRNLYSEFLQEAALLLPELRDTGIIPLSSTISSKWTELAVIFNRIANEKEHELFERAAETVCELAELEQRLFSMLDRTVSV